MLTPQSTSPKLASVLNLQQDVYLKREDLMPEYHSHKGRSIPFMMSIYYEQGIYDFCISSSGNAAIAAATYAKNHNIQNPTKPINLQIFIGKNIAPEKLTTLFTLTQQNSYIRITQTDNPKQSAFLLDKQGASKNLRQSTDDLALTGYHALAEELSAIPNLSAVFIPTSSGTTAQGLFEGFKKIGINPEIHIIQTPACHPFIDSKQTGQSLAHAIVDMVGNRKEHIAQILHSSHGSGWIATDKDILQIQKIIAEEKITDQEKPLVLSPNSALSVAGLMIALKNDWKPNGSVACLITGP